jgi:hypothetical protein
MQAKDGELFELGFENKSVQGRLRVVEADLAEAAAAAAQVLVICTYLNIYIHIFFMCIFTHTRAHAHSPVGGWRRTWPRPWPSPRRVRCKQCEMMIHTRARAHTHKHRRSTALEYMLTQYNSTSGLYIYAIYRQLGHQTCPFGGSGRHGEV